MGQRKRASADTPTGPTLFARHADLALYLAGGLLALAGVVFEDQAGVKTALVLIGAGLLLVGVLLHRVQGTIEMGPTGIKIPIADVLDRLEATRRQAQEQAPDRVLEAVGRAYEALAPLLAIRPEPATGAGDGGSGSGSASTLTPGSEVGTAPVDGHTTGRIPTAPPPAPRAAVPRPRVARDLSPESPEAFAARIVQDVLRTGPKPAPPAPP